MIVLDDLNDYLGSRHERLFDAGLTATHFDRFVKLFARSLQAVDCVGRAENEEATAKLRSLRPIFEEGAARARARTEARVMDQERRERLGRYAWPVVVIAVAVASALIFGSGRNKRNR